MTTATERDVQDIKMRMLKVSELLKIQGFPHDYQLLGNQSDQKKFIGNSVEPNVVKAWTYAMAEAQKTSKKKGYGKRETNIRAHA